MPGKNNPVVSVVIPAFNEEKVLSKCLISLINQNYKNLDIIVVDDGSDDKTSEVASNFDVSLLKIHHSGPGMAKNIGLKNAIGKILVFVDSDMILDKSYIRNLIKPIIKGKSIGTYSTAEYVINLDNVWARCWNINVGMKTNDRLTESVKKDKSVFRAILTSKIIKNGFNSKWGYSDDKSLSTLGVKADAVHDAICFHHNPDSLIDVFLSARWIGRSIDFTLNIKNLIRYSLINSIKVSLVKILSGAPILFIVFKVVFDFGIFTGLIFKNPKHNYAK